MDETGTSEERTIMTALQPTPVIPAHPNLVEMAALLEDSHLRDRDRFDLQRVLHDTVHLVQKQDGTVTSLSASRSPRSGERF